MRVTREKLFEEVWAEPMTTVAKRYGVSSNYLARVCAILNVPRPNRGYWARIQAGHPAKKPELPPAGPEHELEWSRENDGRRWAVIRNGPVAPPSAIMPPAGLHPALRGAGELFRDARTSYWTKYLKPKKRLVTDLWVSESALPRAIKVASTLFKRLDAAGLRVILSQAHHHFVHRRVDERHDRRKQRTTYDTWTPQHPTVAFVGNVAVGLTLFEISDEREYVRWAPIATFRSGLGNRCRVWRRASTRSRRGARVARGAAHDPKALHPNKTPEPPDAASVYQRAIPGGSRTWYGKGANGEIYRFQSDNAGGAHFNGMPGKGGVRMESIPIEVRRALGVVR